MIEESLYEKLKADMAALVSDRIYPNVIPPDVTLPAVIIQRLVGRRIYSHQGEETVVLANFQFTSISSVYRTAKLVSAGLRNSLAGFKGTMGTVKQTKVFAILLDDDYDNYSPDQPFHMVVISGRVIYEEA